MKKQLRYFFTLLLLAVTSVGWAQDVFYTLTPANGSNNSYAGNCDIEIDGITWNLTGNSQMQPWRLGGKTLTDTDRTLYSKTPMGSAISKVSMELGTISLTVNSFKLTVAADAEFSTVIDEVSATVEASKTIDITPSSGSAWASGAYYKFTFNVTTSGSSNQFVQFAKADFYKGTDTSGKTPAGLAYATTTVEKKLGDAAFTNTLTNPNNLTITYTSSDQTVATVSSNGLVTIKGAGTTTITATSKETTKFYTGTATYTLNVIDPNVPGASADNPYTVAQAKAAIDGGSTDNAYVKGIISQIDKVNVNGDATYWISDDGSTASQFEIYRGKYLDGANFSSTDQIRVGDVVVVYGKLAKYSSTYELGAGNKIVSIKTAGKPAAGLAYATATVEKSVGDAAFTNALTNPNNLTVSYKSSNTAVATVGSNGLVTIKGAGTTTITATSAETSNFAAGEASYTLTVTDPNAAGSSADHPFTVAQAMAAIDGGSTANAYVKGIISQIDEVYTQNGNATYWISDDGTTAKQFELYRGKYLDGANFTSADQIAVGDEVVVYGKLTKYGDTYELGSGNKIVSLKHSGKEAAGLAYADDTVEKNLGDAAFTNPLTNPNNLTVSYKSSNEAVATVNSSGLVTIKGAGTTTITATSAETSNFSAGEASYTLTVTNNATVIDLRGKKEPVTFTVMNEFIEGNGYNSYETASLTSSDGTTYAGWSATDVMTGNKTGLQMKASSGKLVSPQILSDKGVMIDVTLTTNTVTITAGEDTSDEGSLSTSSTATNFTLSTGSKYTIVMSITITPLTGTIKQPAGLAYATATIEKEVGDEAFTNELTNPHGLTVSYASSNEKVATVDAKGKVTILAEGTTTITASSEETSTYKAGTASYTLTVKKPVEPQIDNSDIYELVKDASTLANGDVIILVGENTVPAAEEGGEPTTTYFGLSTNQKGNNREAVTVTYNANGTITGNNKLEAITLEGETGAWYFSVTDGYLYAASSDKNYLRTETEADDNAKADITIADDKATILFQGTNTRNDLRFNYSSTNPLFSCYASTSELAKPKIYRKKAAGGLKGDANGDGDVNVTDVMTIVNYLLGRSVPVFIYENANIYEDNDVNVTDIMTIVNYLLGR